MSDQASSHQQNLDDYKQRAIRIRTLYDLLYKLGFTNHDALAITIAYVRSGRD